MSERITEDLVRDHFKNDPLFSTIKFEEQKSFSKRISSLLQAASKSGKGIGKPEFLISFPSGNMDYLLVIECKADCSNHRGKKLNSPKDYAVDGVLHYAEKLSAQFDVVAIAASGQTEHELMVSNFVWRKGEPSYKELKGDAHLLPINDYINLFVNQHFADNLKTIDIVKKAIYLNDIYQEYSITEITRCTTVSAILLALINDGFRLSYGVAQTSRELGENIISAIKNVLKQNKVKNPESMIGEYLKILNEPLFSQDTIKSINKKLPEKSVLVAKEMIEYLDKNVYPLTQMEQNGFDVLGRFYTEFIRYAGSEQGQGLVLTPFHITDLFCDLAEVNESSTIYDPCTGTGGFLIAAMKRMIDLAGNDSKQIEHIKKEQLIGTELRPSMFTYACSNMMLRGDGKSNIYCGDCFSLQKKISENHNPDISFLNPPYDVGSAGQMLFVEHALNIVAPQNGTVVAIVQMSCAVKNENELIAIKKRILQHHHLVAALSMPDDLFYPVGVVTCILVFKSKTTNKGRKTWFGYFKNDGFEKRKHRGRVDARGSWENIKSTWVSAFLNKEEISGLSVKREVAADDEWCAEAYLDTSYASLTETSFIKKIKSYISFKFLENSQNVISSHPHTTTPKIDLHKLKWAEFKYSDVFDIRKGYYNKKPEVSIDGDVIFVGATENNNGITSKHYLEDIEYTSKDGGSNNHELTQKIYEPDCITVSNNGSVGCAFYQDVQFTCSHDVNVLYLKEHPFKINAFVGHFLATLIELEKYRWAYGRKWRPSRMPDSIIKLPVDKKGAPDWVTMEKFIKNLPYSSNL